jgi:ribokinase
VGADAFGDKLLKVVAADGVDATYILRDAEAATGVALITLDSHGQNTIVVASGANARLTPEDILKARPAFESAAILLVQLESPIPAILQAFELARQYGMKVILNPAPALPLDEVFLQGVDILIPNQTELAFLTGKTSPREGALALAAIGISQVIVTLGEHGVLICEDGKALEIPAHPVNVVDTVAAGDAFVGAFAVALLEGKNVEQAARWGNAAGALAVTRAGAQPSLPDRTELEQFLAKS